MSSAFAELERSPCRPTGFAEYDHLTGYVDRVYTVEWTDKTGNLWRKTCTVINLGRPDRGIPVDPDAQMQPEKFPRHVPARPKKPAKPMLRIGEFDEAIPAYLRQYGPAHAKLIAADLGYQYESLHYHLRNNRNNVYCKVGKVGKAVIWGLIGLHDQEAA